MAYKIKKIKTVQLNSTFNFDSPNLPLLKIIYSSIFRITAVNKHVIVAINHLWELVRSSPATSAFTSTTQLTPSLISCLTYSTAKLPTPTAKYKYEYKYFKTVL